MGELSALLSAFLWAATSVGIRFCSAWIDVLWLNAMRCLGGALLVALIASVLAGSPAVLFTIPATTVVWLLLTTLFGYALGDSLYFRATQLIGVSRALPIANTYPLLTLAFAATFLGEALTLQLAGGTLLTISGVYLVARPSGKPLEEVKPRPSAATRRGLLLVACASVCWAVSGAFLKVALMTGDVNLLVANVVRLTFAAMLLLAMIRRSRRPLALQTLDWRFAAVPIAAGLTGATISTSFIVAVQLAGIAKASAITASSPLFALPLSLLFLGERLPRRAMLGTALSVTGVWLLL